MRYQIEVGKHAFATVDAEDFDRFRMLSWHPNRSSDGVPRYAMTGLKLEGQTKHKSVLMHRLVLNASRGQIVDHINGDGFDNRRSNLRLVTAKQNSWNRTPSGPLKLNGVRRTGYKFLAMISPNGRDIYLGTYETAQEAAAVFNSAAKIAYGEYAHLNPGADAPELLAFAIAEKKRNIDRLIAEIAELTRAK